MTNRPNAFFLTITFFLLLSLAVVPVGFGQNSDSLATGRISYGSKGFQLLSADDRFMIQIQSRLQMRYATPADQDPVTFDDINDGNTHLFEINRARLKVGGHAYQPWLKYYWEYELSQSNLLDFRLMIEKWDWLSVKVGQWKVEYSRERRISSGEQQMVDRSLINRPFTLDRQQGVELYGHLAGSGVANFNYWVAALTGTGRGNTFNDDGNLMYFGRVQWNFLGRELGFEGSDLEYHEKPAAILAVAAATNESPYTRFSQAGGGSLQGYDQGDSADFRVKQVNFETAFMYRGFSWQSEWHFKSIEDKSGLLPYNVLEGYYLQAGYFVHYALDWWPRQLELAARHSYYDPGQNPTPIDTGTESSMVFNWFFNGHKNKLTTEVSYFNYSEEFVQLADQWRFRVQWDISL